MIRPREFLKRIVPPLLVDAVRGRPLFPTLPKPSPVWEGTFSHLRDVPTKEPVTSSATTYQRDARRSLEAIAATYEHRSQVDKFAGWTRRALNLVRAGHTPSSPWHDALALVAGVAGAQGTSVRILDFGGGTGLGFVHVLATLRAATSIEYHVIEFDSMVEVGREVFADDTRIQFHTSIPDLIGLDIVYVSSCLEYIEDYTGLLRQLVALGARYILLTQTAVGQFPTYATRQVNLPGHELPYWFLNLGELVGILRECRYSLVFEAEAGPPYDQSNFPETHRVGRMRNLLFSFEPPPTDDSAQ